jgi:membrane protein YqaA with SNARE-associated domain
MLHRLYMRTLALAAAPRALWWLAAVAFAESSFFPIPPDALLIPMALARPDRAWRLAAICLAGSVIGGALGYLIGYAVFDQLARPLIELYGYGDRFAAFQALYARWGLWVILVKGLTPIPYKIVTIASGAARFNFWMFMAASLVTRGARFFIVAALLRYYGTPVRDFIERRLTLVTSLLAAGVVGGFLVLRFL